MSDYDPVLGLTRKAISEFCARHSIPDPSSLKFKVGDRVCLELAHGNGTIVALNQDASGFYSADRYPYVIRFDSGYEDVYSDHGLTKLV